MQPAWPAPAARLLLRALSQWRLDPAACPYPQANTLRPSPLLRQIASFLTPPNPSSSSSSPPPPCACSSCSARCAPTLAHSSSLAAAAQPTGIQGSTCVRTLAPPTPPHTQHSSSSSTTTTTPHHHTSLFTHHHHRQPSSLLASLPTLPHLPPSSDPQQPHGPGPASPQLQAYRSYKSNRRPLKPLNTAASWKAVRSVFPSLSPSPSPSPSPSLSPDGPIVDTCIPPVPEIPKPEPFLKVGRIKGRYTLDLHKTFAVVEVAGTQFKVTRDDVLFVNQLHGADVNDVLQLERVMLLGSRAQTLVGRPYIPNASVLVAVEEHFRDGKIHVFKKKARKRYRKYMTARPHLTTLRVLEVRGIEPAPGDEAESRALPVEWAEGSAPGLPSGRKEKLAVAARPAPSGRKEKLAVAAGPAPSGRKEKLAVAAG